MFEICRMNSDQLQIGNMILLTDTTYPRVVFEFFEYYLEENHQEEPIDLFFDEFLLVLQYSIHVTKLL